MGTITLELPYPPSKNELDQNSRMRHKKTGAYYSGRRQTPQYLQFKNDVYRECRIQRGPGAPIIVCDVVVRIDLYPPDNRRRDLFNTLESLSDALTFAKVWKDDSQIKGTDHIYWGEPVRHGKVVISISDFSQPSLL